jgi:salicylate hydroxylase
MKIAIVGAGLGGLTAALSFIKRGFDVTVFEQASELKELGAGVQLGPNAVGVLYYLGLEKILSQYTTPTEGKNVRLWNTGQRWPLFDLGTLAIELYGFPYLTMHRADLQKILQQEVLRLKPGAIVLNAKVKSATQNGPRVGIEFDSGSRNECDLLVGADGVHSAIRASLFGKHEAKQSGIMAWRGVIDTQKLPSHMLEKVATNWVGPGAHVVQYPLKNGALMNFVGAIEGQRWDKESWSERGSTDECLNDFVGWHPDIQTLIKAIDTPYKWVLKLRDPMSSWTRGSITLLGDACHPMLPFLAQGAGMALEDGYILARCVEKYASAIPQALQRYEALRLERTERVVNGSNANAKRFHNPALANAQGAQAYVSSEWHEEKVKERYDWLFRYNVEAVDV